MIQYHALVQHKCPDHDYYRDRAEGGAGGALAPHFFARIKINLTKNNLTKVTE